jgi:hypothetical protein
VLRGGSLRQAVAAREKLSEELATEVGFLALEGRLSLREEFVGSIESDSKDASS